MGEPLRRETTNLVTDINKAPDAAEFYNNVWKDLNRIDSELTRLIGSEALRLFPDDTINRARATRLVLEILHAQQVNEIESILIA